MYVLFIHCFLVIPFYPPYLCMFVIAVIVCVEAHKKLSILWDLHKYHIK